MAQMTVELLKIENVSKSFDGRKVLNNFSATLSTGKILGLIGKSAAGKSVLIHMVRGTEEYAPDSGKIEYHVNVCKECGHLDLPFEGTPCSACGGTTETQWIDYWSMREHDPLRQELKGRIAIMLQRTFALFGDNTVMENIFEAIGNNVPEKEKVDKTIELLDFVNMTYRTTHIARDLSGGEKQRVVMARQLAKEPLFFLADEPTGTLDPYTAGIIHERLVKYVRDHNICMIFASHWPEAIEKMADEAVWLDSGNIIDRGDPKEVVEKFMAEYHFEKDAGAKLGEPFIVVDNATKHFFSVIRGVVKAVDGVSFEIRENEIFALVGLSGAGKTTTSRMIAGMTPATSGVVKIKIGDDWINMAETGFMGKGRATPYIGFLHQEYTLYPFDTILRNLTTCIGMQMPAELAKVKAIQVLLSVGFPRKDIDKILYMYPDTLSVGECQRIAFAQVLIKEPRIVILDEPTGTMDPITKVTVAKAVLQARRDLGETFIVVSHDMDFVLNCCDRAALMKDGKIVKLGKPEEIVDEFKEIEKSQSQDEAKSKGQNENSGEQN
jgi:methyl coenzyme M reductase system subunit A2